MKSGLLRSEENESREYRENPGGEVGEGWLTSSPYRAYCMLSVRSRIEYIMTIGLYISRKLRFFFQLIIKCTAFFTQHLSRVTTNPILKLLLRIFLLFKLFRSFSMPVRFFLFQFVLRYFLRRSTDREDATSFGRVRDLTVDHAV